MVINHYISTGDYIGTGIAMPEGPQIARRGEPHPDDRISILLLVNTTLKDDLGWNYRFSRF